MVCGYEHGLYDVQLLGWRRQEFRVSKSFGGRAPRTEIVWLNYDETGKRLRQDFSLIQAFENFQPKEEKRCVAKRYRRMPKLCELTTSRVTNLTLGEVP